MEEATAECVSNVYQLIQDDYKGCVEGHGICLSIV